MRRKEVTNQLSKPDSRTNARKWIGSVTFPVSFFLSTPTFPPHIPPRPPYPISQWNSAILQRWTDGVKGCRLCSHAGTKVPTVQLGRSPLPLAKWWSHHRPKTRAKAPPARRRRSSSSSWTSATATVYNSLSLEYCAITFCSMMSDDQKYVSTQTGQSTVNVSTADTCP